MSVRGNVIRGTVRRGEVRCVNVRRGTVLEQWIQNI